ncbi:hypothetical protein DFQ28_006587 [Apophysomyces sp. BC1034]|nr:hypothetical protein DFQ30_003399 [Apophysomyces sp. BC1015]KAG0178566.1 hypothetical protein DFQ29_003284 [Apophysomyces sp. BC1021]KAG0194738.1 hypothetical protein DFQ28_006587 [Apophysomyces sp. BC1034]
MPSDWHTKSVDQILQEFDTSATNGLSDAEVTERQAQYGFNELSKRGAPRWVTILLRQFLDAMNWTFLAFAVIAYVLKDNISGSFLVVISVINFCMSFSQEYSAEKTLAALRGLSSPMASVIRNGREQSVLSKEIVPGDVLLIKEGDSVAADARLIAVSNIEADEALLTGESMPVQKELTIFDSLDQPLGDRLNMIYSSTIISKGRGTAIVVATGMNTEIGTVAKRLKEAGDGDITRLQKSLNKMYFFLLALSVISALIVLASVKFKPNYDIGMYAVTIAMSTLPAGLTTVMTLSLVLGGKEMTKQKALVRKLKCLETLGSLTTIFSDKTGTLTLAKMVVVRIWTPQQGFFYVQSNGLTPDGDMYRTTASSENGHADSEHGERMDKANLPNDIQQLIRCSALCNMASIQRRTEDEKAEKDGDDDSDSDDGDEEPCEWVSTGAPTEVALQVFAHKLNMGKPTLEATGWKLLAEYQFDSQVKCMSTVCVDRSNQMGFVFTKGAAERVLPLCIPTEIDAKIYATVDKLAARGLRVIAMAGRELADVHDTNKQPRSSIEHNLKFIGLVGIYDPPRPESRQAVYEAHRAGITVHMLTGDHEATATAIAKEVNILNETTMSPEQIKKLVMTGAQLDAMSDEDIDKLERLPFVVARCSPDTKVKMIQAATRRRYISAMTGDGVNDSPSLRMADVGISMGKNGSDVAKQASDIVLTDDNFATIIRAIAEGRRLYQNMQRFLMYYWIGMIAVWFILLVCVAVRDPSGKTASPVYVMQLIYMFIAVTPPAGVLSTEPASKTVMLEPPRPSTESILSREIFMDTAAYTIGMIIAGLLAFFVPLYTIGNGVEGIDCDTVYQPGLCDSFFRARACLLVTFNLLVLCCMPHCRSHRTPEWDRAGLIKSLQTHAFTLTVVGNFVLLFLFLYIPVVAIKGFHMMSITWEWGLIIAVVSLFIIFGDVYKFIKRKTMKPLEFHRVDELLL